jgi:hypothetical protein
MIVFLDIRERRISKSEKKKHPEADIMVNTANLQVATLTP